MKNTLQKLGLTEKQAKVYLSLLQLGEDTVFNVSKKASIKRPTCYLVLDELMDKGLIAKNKKENTTLFSAVEPKRLLDLTKEREQTIKSLLPELDAIYNKRPHKPKVQVFEGKQGLEVVYSKVIEEAKKGKEVLFLASLEATKNMTKDSFSYWKEMLMENKKIRGREILNDDKLEREYFKEIQNDKYRIKFIPNSLGMIHSDTIIFDDKVALISYTKDIFATVIESEEIADSFRIFYEMAWGTIRK